MDRPDVPWGVTPTIAEAGSAIREGTLSPVELLEMCLARIHAEEAQTNAFICLDEKSARRKAVQSEREIREGRYRGPLHGIPLGVKDLIDVAGLRTTAHSRVRFEQAPARQNSPAWALLEAAGAILVGKLALHEFALGGSVHDLPWPGARNPWDRTLGINGSSSGSAAAVAAGFVLGALGTDTGGSIRAPALCCGIAGMKPARAAIANEGVLALSPSLDVIGPLARTAEDCEILYRVLSAANESGSVDHPRFTPGGESVAGIRVGLARTWTDAHPPSREIAEAVDAAMKRLTGGGAQLLDVVLPPLGDFVSAVTVIMLAEAWAIHERDLLERYGDYGQIARSRLLAGGLLKASDYLVARRLQQVLTRETESAMRHVDILLTPAGTTLSSPFHQVTPPEALLGPSYVRPFSLTGHPCLATPVSATGTRMPIGVQLACRPGEEALLFRVGRFLATAPGESPQRGEPVL